MAGEQAQQQPRPGARVAEIELPVGLRETAHADAAHPPHAIRATFELDAQRGQRRRRGEHVGALEQAADRALADGHRAQQQGAVESDLSPGIPISRASLQQDGHRHHRPSLGPVRDRYGPAVHDPTLLLTTRGDHGNWPVPSPAQLTEPGVAKAEWGTKRTCLSCGARFYDLRREPIVCPACGAAVDAAVQQAAPGPPGARTGQGRGRCRGGGGRG